MWVRFDNMSAISPLTTSILQCLIPQVGSSFEITVLKDPMNPADVKLQALFVTMQNTVTVDSLSKYVDLTGWNHLALYLDQSLKAWVTLNSQVVGS